MRKLLAYDDSMNNKHSYNSDAMIDLQWTDIDLEKHFFDGQVLRNQVLKNEEGHKSACGLERSFDADLLAV